MLTVTTHLQRRAILREFFELFKTPWTAFDGPGATVLLAGQDSRVPQPDAACRLLIVAGTRPTSWDESNEISIRDRLDAGRIRESASERSLRLYRGITLFECPPAAEPLLVHARGVAAFALRRDNRWEVRLGFDPFTEAEALLSVEGQPESDCGNATLEDHIALLRRLIVGAGLEVVEVANRPPGTPYIACLSHDVDFWGLRRHRWDRTAGGFLSRALIGSPWKALTGKKPWRQALNNVGAGLSYPLVQAGLVADPWRPVDSYRQIEGSLRSTFFVVPRKGHAGISPDGRPRPRRAVAYEAAEMASHLRAAAGSGWEVELHGLDAWLDPQAAQREKAAIEKATSGACRGVRMHWLYFNRHSWHNLDQAGFDYDSTLGYNSAIGFRAGTGQAFRPPGTQQLLELPLTIQDTALFYPDRMGLTEDEALDACDNVLREARRVGGSVVINWHGRSLSPERQWDRAYRWLLDAFSHDRAWVTTAGQTTDWFRARRAVRFRTEGAGLVVSCPQEELALSLRRSRPRGRPEHLLAADIVTVETPLRGAEARVEQCA